MEEDDASPEWLGHVELVIWEGETGYRVLVAVLTIEGEHLQQEQSAQHQGELPGPGRGAGGGEKVCLGYPMDWQGWRFW